MRKLFASLYLYIIISLLLLSGAMEKLWPHKEGENALMLGAEFTQSISLLAQTAQGISQLEQQFDAKKIKQSDIAFLPYQLDKLAKKSSCFII
jgi:hypothetical protein